MSEFYRVTETLGMQDQVTTFTMSEFGRTMVHNTGMGTDHGWGGHQFIMGGSVNGGLYGKMPRLALGADNILGKGILEPTTQIEQMTASIAKWFGLNNNQIQTVFPGLNSTTMNYFS